MFKQRLISGIALVAVTVLGLYLGGIVTLLLTAIVALIGYNEILKIFKNREIISGGPWIHRNDSLLCRIVF